MQVYPVLNSLPQAILFAARAISALAVIITGDFPPSPKVTGVRNLEAAAMTMLPTEPAPVYMIWPLRMLEKGCHHLNGPTNNAEAGIAKVLGKKRGK